MEPGAEEEGAAGVAEFNVAALAQVSDANPYCTLSNFEIEKKIGQGQVSLFGGIFSDLLRLLPFSAV